MAISVLAPYFYACFMRRGMAWKVAMFYGIMVEINAIYDTGMYLNFIVNGPTYMRRILDLNPEESFSAIQMKLFVRWCASQEIKRATQEVPRKQVKDLTLLRSFRNQARDAGFKWLNTLNFLGIYNKPKN